MAKFTKVTMNLTDRDIDNTDNIQKRFHSRSKADAVSAALALTSTIAKEMKKGSQLLIKTSDGEVKQIISTDMDS